MSQPNNNNLIDLIYLLNIFYTYKTPAKIRARILAGVFAIINDTVLRITSNNEMM